MDVQQRPLSTSVIITAGNDRFYKKETPSTAVFPREDIGNLPRKRVLLIDDKKVLFNERTVP